MLYGHIEKDQWYIYCLQKCQTYLVPIALLGSSFVNAPIVISHTVRLTEKLHAHWCTYLSHETFNQFYNLRFNNLQQQPPRNNLSRQNWLKMASKNPRILLQQGSIPNLRKLLPVPKFLGKCNKVQTCVM